MRLAHNTQFKLLRWTQNKIKANMKLKRSDNSIKRYLTKVYENLNKHKASRLLVELEMNFLKKSCRKEHECINCKQSIENNCKRSVREEHKKTS